MNTQILRERKEALKQRLRILILQNAREGSVYDERFLLEVHHVSEQLLHLRQKESEYEKASGPRRMAGIVPTVVAHS